MLMIILAIVVSAATGNAPLSHDGPNENAPEQVKEFGQLVGDWSCAGENLNPDGEWQKSPGRATWSWYYILEGFGVQDVWLPDREQNPNAPMGTNVRTFDPETGLWEVVWATQAVPKFDRYKASFRNGEIHIFAERPATKQFRSHLMRITFHNISADHFDWRYEASGLTDGQNWQERSRLSCDRVRG